MTYVSVLVQLHKQLMQHSRRNLACALLGAAAAADATYSRWLCTKRAKLLNVVES